MIPDQGTLLPLCSRCQQRPRRPGQRWCQPCANQYKSQRYWRLKTEEGGAHDVIPAPSQAEKPIGLCRLCGMGAWFEWSPNTWRCALCGIRPAL